MTLTCTAPTVKTKAIATPAWTFIPPGAVPSVNADFFGPDTTGPRAEDDRGSGRRYAVTIGRYQPHCDPETGRELYICFTVVDIEVPVEATFMGFGEQDQVVAYVAERYPSWEICESYAKGTGC